MNTTQPDAPAPDVLVDVHHLTAEQLQQLGVSRVAYVKKVQFNGSPAYAIHGADGRPMAVADDLNLALAAIIRQEMAPALVH